MKYAIYETKEGCFYAARYIDNPAELKDYPYILESSLPVKVNSRGGYCSFIPALETQETGFVEIRECDGEPLTFAEMFPKNSPNFEYGWLSPSGDTYKCPHCEHYDCAIAICENQGYDTYNADLVLEKLRWCKVALDNAKNKPILYFEELTEAQINAIYRLNLVTPEVERYMKR